ncbi:hypothetical protein GGP80_003315 [Salinibacter ruber]|uniref:hypothetical protein n=1 Tax=Salinibacter ruber TaxID=146919 RepID=UPI0021675921|nr:hypothetical protein [Salinibacter ruber]MCS3937305.1 hypothetical protein [Salinibacter ruber]
MAIDELEVLLNLDLGPLEDKVDDAIDEVDRLDGKSTDNLEDDFEDTAEAADDLTESMEDADSQSVRPDVDSSEITQLQRRLAALDGRSVEIDADVDRERLRGAIGGGGGGRTGGIFGGNRLPGELDEVQEGFMALGAVPPQLKALGAAGATAAAALGAGAGLAGVATKLAAELGPQGLQSDVQGARATFKETGREFASAFSGVIRSEVLPAARGLATVIQSIDDDLATFSGIMIDLLKNIQGVGPVIGAVVGAGRAAGQSQSNADALAQGVGNVPGIREITRTMTQAIERVRERFERDLIPKEEMLSQIKSLRLDAVKQLQKLEQQVPGAFPPALLDAFVAKLKQVRKQLKNIRTISDEELKQATLQPADASQVDPAGQASLQTGKGIGARIPDRLEGISNASKKVARLRKRLQQTSVLGRQATGILRRGFLRVGNAVGEGVTRALFQAESAVAALRGTFQNVVQSILSQLTSLVTKLLVIKPLISALGIGATGGLAAPGVVGQVGAGIFPFAEGGVVTGPTLGLIGEAGEDEAVMPLSRLNGMVEKAAAMGANVSAAVSGRSIGVQQAGSATTRIEGGSLSIDVPVEAVHTSSRIGASNKRRTGREV